MQRGLSSGRAWDPSSALQRGTSGQSLTWFFSGMKWRKQSHLPSRAAVKTTRVNKWKMLGPAPGVSVEFSKQQLFLVVRPSFVGHLPRVRHGGVAM